MDPVWAIVGGLAVLAMYILLIRWLARHMKW